MASWKGLRTGEQEAELRQLWAYFYTQTATIGRADTGVLVGCQVVATTPSANGSVVVTYGLAIAQPSTASGAFPMPNTAVSLDVFTANPMQFVSNPRNDIVIMDSADGQVKVLVGTPNANPSLGEVAVPATAVPLARLRHAAGATTIPNSVIDDLRNIVLPFGVRLPAVTARTSSSTNTSNNNEVTILNSGAVAGNGSRRFKVSLAWFSASTTVDPTTAEVRIYRGGTLIRDARITPDRGASGVLGGSTFGTDVPPAGSATYTAKLVRVSGTGVITLSGDIELLVEHVA